MGSAPRANYQHALAPDGNLEILLEVSQEPDAVGVVALQPASGQLDRVDRLGVEGVTAMAIDDVPCFALERQRDVQASAAFMVIEELADRCFESIERGKQSVVGDVLARSARERAMDVGRKAVADRVADHRVLIWHPRLKFRV